ncbi:MAG: arylesterase [Thiolinea sp.]
MQRFFALYVFLLLSTLLPTHTVVFADDTDLPPEKPVILVWGDSLSAAYGIPVEQGWVSLLRERVQETHDVVNGSISGETTVGGLTRLPDALALHEPDYVLLELGANDGLRGLPTERMQKNLSEMIDLALEAKAKPVLLGIKIPPNYGMAYTDKFDQVFSDLAAEYEIPLLPFLLEGVAEDFDLMQEDGLHPTAEAQPQILAHVWEVLEPVLSAEKQLAEGNATVSTEPVAAGQH